MDQSLQNNLAREHMPLVERIAATMKRRLGSDVDMSDIRSFALEGLASSLRRYDPSRGASFKTFAEPRIRGAIYDGLSSMDWFPRRLRRKITFCRQAEEMLRYQADEPRASDQVEAVHRVADTLKDLATAYVTTYFVEGANEPASSPTGMEYLLELKRYAEYINACIDMLPDKERHVVRCYFYEEMTIPEIAELLGVNKSWISRILKRALVDIRKNFTGLPPRIEEF